MALDDKILTEEKIMAELLTLSHYTTQNTVTPIIMQYTILENEGMKPKDILDTLKKIYTPNTYNGQKE